MTQNAATLRKEFYVLRTVKARLKQVANRVQIPEAIVLLLHDAKTDDKGVKFFTSERVDELDDPE